MTFDSTNMNFSELKFSVIYSNKGKYINLNSEYNPAIAAALSKCMISINCTRDHITLDGIVCRRFLPVIEAATKQ